MSYTIATEEVARTGTARTGAGAHGWSGLVGSSLEFQLCVGKARELAAGNSAPILVVGEPGTGKELMARACHFEGGRSTEPFVIVDCRTLDRRLFESELFGSESGAIPGLIGGRQGLLETAGGGTLFLRRIDEMPISLQPRLVSAIVQSAARRVGGLEEFPVHCRISASASPRIDEAREAGRFRDDLYDQFVDSRLELPPLRDRGEDLVELAEHFQTLCAATEGLPSREFSQDAVDALRGRDWKGNIRELKRVVRQAVLEGRSETIELGDLPFSTERPTRVGANGEITIVIPPAGRTLDEVEAEVIAATLRLTSHNKSRTARILGISRPTLRRKARLYGVPLD